MAKTTYAAQIYNMTLGAKKEEPTKEVGLLARSGAPRKKSTGKDQPFDFVLEKTLQIRSLRGKIKEKGKTVV
jgi:hypothetical protein